VEIIDYQEVLDIVATRPSDQTFLIAIFIQFLEDTLFCNTLINESLRRAETMSTRNDLWPFSTDSAESSIYLARTGSGSFVNGPAESRQRYRFKSYRLRGE
jgi:hypothetical protein